MVLIMSLTFLVFLIIGTPIAFSLGFAGLLGFLLHDPSYMPLIPQRMYAAMDSFPMMAVPFFILAGDLMTTTGILTGLVHLAERLVGHIRGGLAHVVMVAEMFFSGIGGSAIADASALGTVLIPPMEKRYGAEFSAAVVAASATIGPIIPPSIAMVIYAFVVGHVSVGGLFLAGVIPGILLGVGMMGVIYVTARKRGFEPTGRRASVREIGSAFREALWALIMPLIIIGGILGGVFTATEAAAVAVGYALLVGRFITKELRWAHVQQALSRAVLVSAVVFALVATSGIVSWVLTVSRAPQLISEYMRQLSENPVVFLLLANFFILILGCVLDNVAAMIMVAPILAPIAGAYGIDPLHFGFVFVLNSVIGLLTPPVGAVLFTVCGIANVTIERVFREVWPLLLWQIVVLALVTYVPVISLGLPHLLGYGR